VPVFHELGQIEHWGSGIQRMTAACTDAGLPAPVLEEMGSRFRATLSMIASGPARLDKKDGAILRLLADGRGHSTARIAKAASLSVRAVRTRLKALVERGLVVEVGSSPQDPRRLYFRAEPAG